jgi:hypothetical protein
MKLIILKTIDGYQHSFLLPKLMTSVMAPGVLTTVGTEVPVAGEGMPSKHLLSYPSSGHSVAYVWKLSIFISTAGILRYLLLIIPKN